MADKIVPMNKDNQQIKLTINRFELIRITNRLDEGFVEIEVLDTEGTQLITQQIDADLLKIFE